ncbi:MAG: prolyl oligopeptidase family serine peptidase [Acidobacteriota bacterium]
MKLVLLLPWAVVAAACAADAVQPPAASRSLTIDQLIDIRHPSDPVWSPDGARVAFLWDRAGVTNLYVADARPGGESAPRALTAFQDGTAAGAFWSRDSQRVYFMRAGDLWHVAASGGGPSPAWSTPAAETGVVLAPDGTRVAFVRPTSSPARTPDASGGVDLYTRTLEDGRELRVAHDAVSLTNVAWSPDGKHLSYAAGARSVRHEQTPDYSGAKIIYTITERTPAQAYVVRASGGSPVSVGTPGGGGVRWVDSQRVVFDRQSPDYKRRTIFVADITTGRASILHEDVDDKFWSIPGGAGAAGLPSPDGKWIAFLSDRDGWDHLYVMPAAGGAAVQITRGRFEAWRPSWSPDSTRLAFDANGPDAPGTRHLGIATLGSDPSSATVTMITKGRGTNAAPVWSPDGTHVVYQHTDPRSSADLFLVLSREGAEPRRLSRSMPASLATTTFVEPELVRYPGPDGQSVPAWLFVPPQLDRSRAHPAIVWIHGDGVNQGYDGWHVQRNYAVYYSFHQYLLQQGYVVLAPDYRGSIGYGRDWRQGVYMDVGGKDAKDAWMAAEYLKTLRFVDTERVGVWGLSYGGFFTLIAMTDQPTLFRAGVDVAGVVDYAMYYEDPYHGGWTTSRIGTPEQNPDVYKQASPLSHVGRLERPLLVLHGTADVNVPHLHSVRLVDALMKHGKSHLFSFMEYPGEFHYFTRAHVLKDAWLRVDRFFAEHLRAQPASTQ